MLKKHRNALIITSIVAIALVFYMYSKNYITFESGIHIVIPQEPNEKYVESEFQPANTETSEITENTSRLKILPPSSEDNKIDDSRFYDDMMKFVETFMPLLVTLIPIYLNQRSKRKAKVADA